MIIRAILVSGRDWSSSLVSTFVSFSSTETETVPSTRGLTTSQHQLNNSYHQKKGGNNIEQHDALISVPRGMGDDTLFHAGRSGTMLVMCKNIFITAMEYNS